MSVKLDKTKMVKNLVRRTKLAPHLDKALGATDFVWEYKYAPKKEDTGWHPSGHCTPSLAELYHYAIGEDDPSSPIDGSAPVRKNRTEGFTAATYKTFQVGHFWHSYLQHVVVHRLGFSRDEYVERRGFRGWGDRIHSGSHQGKEVVKYRDWHYVTGSADIAPCHIPFHGDYLLDFKTMGSHAYKPNTPPGDYLTKWECQLNVYMDFFDLEQALVLAILKDSPHEFKEFEYKRNQPLIDALYQKWELVSQCIEERVEPPLDEEVPLPVRGPIEQ